MMHEKLLTCLGPFQSFTSADPNQLATCVDKYVSSLSQVMHDAASKEAVCVCVPKKVFRPEAWWCPALSLLRDRKRFWWAPWQSAGKPRSCELYNCYKCITKLHRQN